MTANEAVALRLDAHFGADRDVRQRCLWLLALNRGMPVARVARAARVSRPTVYRYARLWGLYRSPDCLSTPAARRLLPWRQRPAPSRGPSS